MIEFGSSDVTDPLFTLLVSGDVADPNNMEPGTRAIRRFNEMLKQDDSVDISLVPIGDGLTLVRKSDA